MEQIFKTLLKNSGFEHIGIIDAEKKIWGYAKDSIFHFCKEDLAEIDKKDCGITDTLIVLSSLDEKLLIVDETTNFDNYIAIDHENRIIKKEISCGFNRDKYRLKRINKSSAVILSKDFWWYEFKKKDNEELVDFLCEEYWDRYDTPVAFIDEKLCDEYITLRYYGALYIFKNKDSDSDQFLIYDSNKGIVYNGDAPKFWFHSNGDIELVRIFNESEENSDTESIYYNDKYCNARYVELCNINKGTSRVLNVEKYKDNFTDAVNECFAADDILLIPYVNNEGALVIYANETKEHYISFKWNRNKTISFKDSIIKQGDVSRYGTFYNFVFYNIDGKYLGETEDERDSFLIFENADYKYYNKEDIKTSQEFWDKTYRANGHFVGVLCLWNLSIIVPPIFERIKILNKEIPLFEVIYANWVQGSREEYKGIYSQEGLVVPLGMNIEYLDYYIDGNHVLSSDYIVYSYGDKCGLIYNGEKVSELIYDQIWGYSIGVPCEKGVDNMEKIEDNEDYNRYYEDITNFIPNKFNNYMGFPEFFLPLQDAEVCIHSGKPKVSPQCCFLRRDGLWGIFKDEKHYTEIKYKEIGILRFDESEYGRISDEIFFKVSYIDEDMGYEEELLDKNLNEIPVMEHPVEKVFQNHYIAGGKLYEWKGEEPLFDMRPEASDWWDEHCYKFLKYEIEKNCFVFRNDQYYAFVFTWKKCILKEIDSFMEDTEEDIFEIRNFEYIDVCDNLRYNITNNYLYTPNNDDCYYEDPGYFQQELDQIYRDAFDGNPESEWNID